jgi:hypothetical protein
MVNTIQHQNESTRMACPANLVPGLNDAVLSIGTEKITTSASLYVLLQL